MNKRYTAKFFLKHNIDQHISITDLSDRDVIIIKNLNTLEDGRRVLTQNFNPEDSNPPRLRSNINLDEIVYIEFIEEDETNN